MLTLFMWALSFTTFWGGGVAKQMLFEDKNLFYRNESFNILRKQEINRKSKKYKVLVLFFVLLGGNEILSKRQLREREREREKDRERRREREKEQRERKREERERERERERGRRRERDREREDG